MGNLVFRKCIMNFTRRKKVLHAITIPDANKTISQFYNIVKLLMSSIDHHCTESLYKKT